MSFVFINCSFEFGINFTLGTTISSLEFLLCLQCSLSFNKFCIFNDLVSAALKTSFALWIWFKGVQWLFGAGQMSFRS